MITAAIHTSNKELYSYPLRRIWLFLSILFSTTSIVLGKSPASTAKVDTGLEQSPQPCRRRDGAPLFTLCKCLGHKTSSVWTVDSSFSFFRVRACLNKKDDMITRVLRASQICNSRHRRRLPYQGLLRVKKTGWQRILIEAMRSMSAVGMVYNSSREAPSDRGQRYNVTDDN